MVLEPKTMQEPQKWVFQVHALLVSKNKSKSKYSFVTFTSTCIHCLKSRNKDPVRSKLNVVFLFHTSKTVFVLASVYDLFTLELYSMHESPYVAGREGTSLPLSDGSCDILYSSN